MSSRFQASSSSSTRSGHPDNHRAVDRKQEKNENKPTDNNKMNNATFDAKKNTNSRIEYAICFLFTIFICFPFGIRNGKIRSNIFLQDILIYALGH